MKTFRLILLVSAVWLGCFRNARAQLEKDTLVSGNFQGINFQEFARRIDSSTPYRIFYDSTQVGPLIIHLTVNEETVARLLDQVLAGTGLRYAMSGGKQVFITRGPVIRTGLPPGFFDINPDTAGQWAYSQGFAPGSPAGGNQVSPENKLFEVGRKTNHLKAGNSNIAGYVRNSRNGEALQGAILYITNPHIEATTDRFGYYSITLPRGPHTLYIVGPGMEDISRKIMVYTEGRMNVNMQEKILSLKMVTIESKGAGNVRSTQMGVQQISNTSLSQIPAAFGETDILRAVLTLPGVQSVGEASTGLDVRGGATDQNLILFNGMTIYNPSHFFGFFSAFDPDLVKNITLYDGSIPAKYGGRLASVLDITSLEGNSKKFTGTAGISPLTGKITLQGPIGKKTTFIAGARSTYSDWLLNLLPQQYRKSRASFYDATLHISHTIDEHNSLYLTGYLSEDSFNLNGDTTYSYGNRNANVQWKHMFSNTFFGVMTAGYDGYAYEVSSTGNQVQGFKLGFNINQYVGKLDFTWYQGPRHTLEFGLDNTYYLLHPGEFDPLGKNSLVNADTLQAERAFQDALYISDHFRVSDKFSLDYGIRYSLYNDLGVGSVFNYAAGQPRTIADILDTLHYGPGKIIKTYGGPEFRFSAKYALPGESSLKLAFNSMRQYISMLSNTATAYPTDIWKLSDTYIKPQTGQQVSLGYYHNFKANTIETSVEVYYKWVQHYLDYKDGAVLLMNSHIETDVINSNGRDYGVELLVRKLTGKLNGWISYTWSRSLIRENDPLAGEQVNFGNYYPSNYDKPNDLNITSNYRINHRFSLSLDLTYSTGRPITLPIGLYNYGGSERALYSERNQYRIPDYFRMDFSMNILGNHKIKQVAHNSWTLGVYNLTGRKNAYSVYFISSNGTVKGYQLSIFGSAIPYVTYNIKF
ncbi:MAG TPA: TonB-dependent receptor [Chitinophagaceae bacterium]|nr:TonB-dependent receptor [Chitinophagaceae bacterium]